MAEAYSRSLLVQMPLASHGVVAAAVRAVHSLQALIQQSATLEHGFD